MKTGKSMESKSLAERAYIMLSQYIVEGKLRPGQQILAKNLSKSLAMGRTPVREALLRLQNDGIIICNSRHSYNIRVLTVHDVKEIYETLGALEGWVAGAVCRKITPKDFEALQEYNRLIWQATKRSDLAEYGRWNHEFHDVFLKCFGNQMVQKFCDSIRKQLYAYPVKGKLVHEWMKHSANEHEEVIQLVRNRQSKKLEIYFREVHWSFSKSRQYLEDSFHPDGQFPVPA
jgi:DNA-binding GntR family transcriptional regulator